jgi:asparagine synthase (glutamine-hydrolysing)
LRTASRRLAHRGPDAQSELEVGGFFGLHNRLAIIDIAAGQQPMADHDNGNVVVFNGEIYNYIELRERLRGHGHGFGPISDTEVLLKAYAQFGDEMVHELNGMFAFALYDVAANRLLLARDRFGEKPLYHFTREGIFCFASELGALREVHGCPSDTSDASILEYFLTGAVAGPGSLITGVHQLPPGRTLSIASGHAVERTYFALSKRVQLDPPSDDEIGDALTRAIAMRLRADVPVATLLSGGLDSSIITTLAQRVKCTPLQSFAFGWDGEESELPFARQVADRVGTHHHEILLDRRVFERDVDRMTAAMDQPLADSAAFVVYELTKEIASRGVKVVLSGEGGDELFGGYPWYTGVSDTRQRVKRALLGSARGIRDYVRDKSVFDESLASQAFGRDAVERFWTGREAIFAECGDTVQGRIEYDYRYFVPWTLIPKVDRMSMAHAVEVRAPFLDHTLVERWFAISDRHKVAAGTQKALLKAFIRRSGVLEASLLDRRKMGMNLPIAWWIRMNVDLFRETLLDAGSFTAALFGRDAIVGWLADNQTSTTHAWTRTSQMLWSCFVFERWRRQDPRRVGGGTA